MAKVGGQGNLKYVFNMSHVNFLEKSITGLLTATSRNWIRSYVVSSLSRRCYNVDTQTLYHQTGCHHKVA